VSEQETAPTVADSALERIGECPNCKGILTPQAIRLGPFDCPYCARSIKPIRRPSYLWLRTLVCVIIAVGAARRSGFDWSFLIFVVSFYAIPAFVLWDAIVFRFFPPTKFEPVSSSSFQTLGINKR
jgi:hypothetical protein